MSTGRALAALAALALAASTALAGPPQGGGKFTTPGPTTTKAPGDAAGSLGSITAGAKAEPDSTTVSLDAVAANPSRYEGKVLARRVTLGATKPYGSAVSIAARDAETGKKLEAGPAAGFALVATRELAERFAAEHKADVVAVFTVAKIGIPGQESWVGVVARVEILGQDGSVAKTITE